MSGSESDEDKKPAANAPLPVSRSSCTEHGPSPSSLDDAKLSSERGRSPVQIPFLFVVKLYELLRDCEHDHDGKGQIISWTPDGKSFKVHKPKEIIVSILPTYFNQSKYKSFQRQRK
jgi:HSF-type DNA-binding